MKWIHRISVVYFCIAIAIFAICATKYYMNRDAEGPVIKIENDMIKLDVSAKSEDILADVTAWDSKDGDVSDTLMVEYISNFIGDNQREVGIVAFDEDGHVSKASRIVQYNYTGIKYELSAPLRFPVGTSAAKIKQGLTATDGFDGGVTRWIMMNNVDDGVLDTTVAGEYPVEFSVSNSAGDVEKFVATVEMYSSSQEVVAPKISLRKYMLYLEQGSQFDPIKYVDTVVFDDTLYHMDIDEEAAIVREHIVIDNTVDTMQLGWYEVSYKIKDSVNNSKTIHLLVCVTKKGE